MLEPYRLSLGPQRRRPRCLAPGHGSGGSPAERSRQGLRVRPEGQRLGLRNLKSTCRHGGNRDLRDRAIHLREQFPGFRLRLNPFDSLISSLDRCWRTVRRLTEGLLLEERPIVLPSLAALTPTHRRSPVEVAVGRVRLSKPWADERWLQPLPRAREEQTGAELVFLSAVLDFQDREQAEVGRPSYSALDLGASEKRGLSALKVSLSSASC